MNSDAFVSFRSGRPEGPRVRVTPAPLLELLYAAFYLTRWSGEDDDALPWARRLWREAPDVARAAAALARRDVPSPAPTLFPLAMSSGHALDPSPERFLARLPELAEQARGRLHEAVDDAGAPPDDPEAAASAADVDEALARWLLTPDDPAWPETAQATLRALWAELGPGWEAEGRPLAEAAAARVRAGLDEHGDVLRALPEHHFAQFEKLAASLRQAAERGRLWIVPLALAAGGGFHTEVDETTALGFGLQSDQAHARAEQRVAAAAAIAKALADPTRLMLLHLVARYPGLSLTVGDLAGQLGVSQPTVSGHLKQLRDAGLVGSERRGNRSYPRVDRAALDAALQRLDQVLAPDRPS
jgi:ArsR family transcriptional regulator